MGRSPPVSLPGLSAGARLSGRSLQRIGQKAATLRAHPERLAWALESGRALHASVL
ncbi:MAG: hypothetical protein HY791_28055 [Deltaproteobacteria bacterium]|nr:hypothetical protein [Deltaproteobacteria bacterium]